MTFHLEEKAKAVGAQVAVLEPVHRQDVAALARRAVDDGADVLGFAGGDGTQALVAGGTANADDGTDSGRASAPERRGSRAGLEKEPEARV